MKVIGVITGILLAILGAYGFMHPALLFAGLGWLVGLFVLISGIGGVASWGDARKAGQASVWNLVLAIISIVLGIFVLCNVWSRLFTDEMLIVLFGVWIAVAGVVRIVVSVRQKPAWWGWMVAWGVILVITSVLALAHPVMTAVSIGFCMALTLLFQGINLIVGTFTKKKETD